jgi:hypothetical protein
MEEVRKVAALFPGSTFVPVAEAGHTTLGAGQCAVGLTSEFFGTLQLGDISCTQTPEKQAIQVIIALRNLQLQKRKRFDKTKNENKSG